MKELPHVTTLMGTLNHWLLFHRCSFCRRGTGRIFVDTKQAVQWKPPPSRDIAIGKTPDQPVVLFQPRVAKPCPHVIYLLVDVNLLYGAEHRSDTTFTWVNPWFDANDPARTAMNLLWDEVVDPWYLGEPSLYRPSIPFDIRRPSREIRRPHHGDPEGRSEIEGWVICAADARKFCGELGEVLLSRLARKVTAQ